MKPFSTTAAPTSTPCSGNWKLRSKANPPNYNLETDIGEKQNVLKANPDIVRRLQNHLQTFTNDIKKQSAGRFVENAKPLSK